MREKIIINHINNSNYTDLNVIGARYENCSKNKETRYMHNFMSFSLHFVIAGKGIFTINGKNFEVEKDSIFCIFPDNQIEYDPDRKKPWTYYRINFKNVIKSLSTDKNSVIIKKKELTMKTKLVSVGLSIFLLFGVAVGCNK